MKLPHIALPFLLVFTAGFLRADYSFKEPFTRSGAFDATGVVTLENVSGNVEIRTWDKNEISIEGEMSAKTQEELKQIEMNIDVSPARTDIKVKFPKRDGSSWGGENIRANVSFKLRVPANAVLEKISTVNSSVTIEGIHGTVNASTVNGAIFAKELGGGAKLNTVNGTVEAAFSQVGADQKLSFNTVNGQIHVRLPKDAGFKLNGSTVNGRVSCDFPLSEMKKSWGGLSGTSGDGRATLKASTVNGAVRIESL